MKKIISSLVSLTLLVAPVVALAQDEPPITPPDWGEVEIWEVLDTLTNYLFWILMIVAAIFIIIAGYFFVTAAGDPDKTKRARDFVLYALIGVLVGFVAKGLIYFIGGIVGIT